MSRFHLVASIVAAAAEQLEVAYKLAASRFLLHAGAMTQFNMAHVNENSRRESICGSKLDQIIEQEPPDVEAIYCHSRMMMARAKSLTRMASMR
jgi:hypothetical protein